MFQCMHVGMGGGASLIWAMYGFMLFEGFCLSFLKNGQKNIWKEKEGSSCACYQTDQTEKRTLGKLWI